VGKFALMLTKPIVVVGSINMDLVVAVESIPVPGQTVRATSFQTIPGGKGANQAVAVARLGWPVYLIGKVGSDSFGSLLRDHLHRAGVNTDFVKTINAASGTATITVDSRGQNSIVVAGGANDQVLPEDIDLCENVIRSAGFVLSQLEIPLSAVLHLAHLCRRVRVPFMLDPAPARKLPGDLLESVTWLTPNESETEIVLGSSKNNHDEASCAQAILDLGVENVVLKRGENGSYVGVRDPQLRFHSDAFPVKPVDTTAAGDAFNGALAVALSHQHDIQTAIRFASATAAISVTRIGAQPSMPSLHEVREFLEERVSSAGAHGK